MSPDIGEITIGTVSWGTYQTELRRIYLRVFAEELALFRPNEPNFLDDDPSLVHVLATDQNKPVAYARITKAGHIIYLAVLPNYRGIGLGADMLDFIVSEFSKRGVLALTVKSREISTPLFERSGFMSTGEDYEHNGLPYFIMQKPLDYTDCDHFVSGVGYPQPFDVLARALAANATRSLRIISPNLDPQVFDNETLAESVAALARKSRHSIVQILVGDTSMMIKRSHRFTNLIQRMSSNVHLRQLKNHPSWQGDTAVLCDNRGVLYKPAKDQHSGFYRPDSPSSCIRYLQQFEELWNAAQEDPQLRVLSHL